jgi:metal-sulfur cluster biosynthetic enzyme
MTTSTLDPQTIWSTLATIPDPEFGISLVDLGLIYSVECDERRIHVVMTLTTVTCPSGGWMHEGVKAAVEKIADGREVQVDLVFEPAWSPEMLSDSAKRQLGWTRE